jgi:chromosome segregation ATPase
VCAIAIGLGASPKLLGRSDKLSEFVMQGCEDGYVEVEVFRQGRENHIIRRCFTKASDSSKFLLDGKPSTQKIIQEIVERTGAQLGNLCTFLPQEMVGEFSGFDAMQLLVETEKAVGGPDLYEDHLKLTKQETQLSDHSRQVDAQRARVADLKLQNQALERDREKMDQRDRHLVCDGWSLSTNLSPN